VKGERWPHRKEQVPPLSLSPSPLALTSLPLLLPLCFFHISIFFKIESHFIYLVQAKKSASALKKGSGRKATKIHNKVHFYKPRTLKLARNPVASIKTSKGASKFDAYKIVKFPLTTESAMKKIEDNNTLVFIVDVTSNKRQIKEAVSKLYSIKAEKVNTLIRFVHPFLLLFSLHLSFAPP
jgi:large subunit ribosomal protein L23Ae